MEIVIFTGHNKYQNRYRWIVSLLGSMDLKKISQKVVQRCLKIKTMSGIVRNKEKLVQFVVKKNEIPNKNNQAFQDL